MAQVNKVRLAASAALICMALGSGPLEASPSDPSLAAVQSAVRDIRDRIAAQRSSAPQLLELRPPARKERIAEPLR